MILDDEKRLPTGICFDPITSKYRAIISMSGTDVHLGCFDHLADAIIMRDAAAEILGKPRHISGGILPRRFLADARAKLKQAKKNLPPENRTRRGRAPMTDGQKAAMTAKRMATRRQNLVTEFAQDQASIYCHPTRPRIENIDPGMSTLELTRRLGVMGSEQHWELLNEDMGPWPAQDRKIYMQAFARRCIAIWNRRDRQEAAKQVGSGT